MKTSLRRFTTEDRLELIGFLHEPDGGASEVVVYVHGMAANGYESVFLDEIAKTLTNNGIALFSFNNRGCEFFKGIPKLENGTRTFVRIGNAYEKFEESILDIRAAIDAITEWGYTRVRLAGHSLGTVKVAYYAAESGDDRVQSVLLLSPSDMLGLARRDGHEFTRDSAEARQLVESGNGSMLLSHQVWDKYFLSAETYLNLFDDSAKTGVFNFYDPVDALPTLAKIAQPIFAVMGRNDHVLVVPIEEIFERITKAAAQSTGVTTHILGDANHGYHGYEQELADTIVGWVQM